MAAYPLNPGLSYLVSDCGVTRLVFASNPVDAILVALALLQEAI